MKSIIAAASLFLASAAMPSAAVAQEISAAATIVVSGKYQKDWDKGSKLEAKGLDDLAKAKKNLVGYSADVVNAQNKRDGSRARAENYSAEFRKLTASITYFSDPEEAARWARQVEKAAASWAKHDDRRGDGRNDLAKAMKQQTKAQASVDKAQAMVDRGRTLKVEAERLSLLDKRS